MRKQLRMKEVLDAKKVLATLPPPSASPNQAVSKIEAIKRLFPELEKAREQGYSYEQLSDLLFRHQIEIKPTTLKSYINRFSEDRVAHSEGVQPLSEADAASVIERVTGRSLTGDSGANHQVAPAAIDEDSKGSSASDERRSDPSIGMTRGFSKFSDRKKQSM